MGRQPDGSVVICIEAVIALIRHRSAGSGQLGDTRPITRRARTTTSAATSIRRVRQVPAKLSARGSRSRRQLKNVLRCGSGSASAVRWSRVCNPEWNGISVSMITLDGAGVDTNDKVSAAGLGLDRTPAERRSPIEGRVAESQPPVGLRWIERGSGRDWGSDPRTQVGVPTSPGDSSGRQGSPSRFGLAKGPATGRPPPPALRRNEAFPPSVACETRFNLS